MSGQGKSSFCNILLFLLFCKRPFKEKAMKKKLILQPRNNHANSFDQTIVSLCEKAKGTDVFTSFNATRSNLQKQLGGGYTAFLVRFSKTIREISFPSFPEFSALEDLPPEQKKFIENAISHSLDVITVILQLETMFNTTEKKSIEAEKKGLNKLMTFNPQTATKSIALIRDLLTLKDNNNDDISLPEIIDSLLRIAILHDAAKYAELLNPEISHEQHMYNSIEKLKINITEAEKHIIRLHVHFGITYNGEYDPLVLIEEINKIKDCGFTENKNKQIFHLTAAFTLFDVSSYGVCTNTMVMELYNMVLGNETSNLNLLIGELYKNNNQYKELANIFRREFAQYKLMSLIRFGDFDIDKKDLASAIRSAMQIIITHTDGRIDQDKIDTLNDILTNNVKIFRYINYLVKAIRLQSLPAAINFILMIASVAKKAQVENLIFVASHGDPIHKIENLSEQLELFVSKLLFAIDTKTDNGTDYYLVDSAGAMLPDSPIISKVKLGNGQEILCVRFPTFITPSLKETLRKGGIISLGDANCFPLVVGLQKEQIFTAHGVHIPKSDINTYKSTFNPVLAMAIIQAIINTSPETIQTAAIAYDDSLWAKEYANYIAQVLIGNNISVNLATTPLPIGVIAGNHSDLKIVLSAGSHGRNFGFGIYTKNGAITDKVITKIWAGLEELIAKGGYISVGQLNQANPLEITYTTPKINIKNNMPQIYTSSQEIVSSMQNLLYKKYGDTWKENIDITLAAHRRPHFCSFDTTDFLQDNFARTLLLQPKATSVVINHNASRIGLLERVNLETALKLDTFYGIKITHQNDKHAIVHYNSYHIWTMLAHYCATSYSGDDGVFIVSFPVTSNIDRIAKKFDIKVIRTNVGEGSFAKIIPTIINQGHSPLLFCEQNGAGNIVSNNNSRIARQSDPLQIALVLMKLISKKESPGNYYLSIAEEITLNQFAKFNIRKAFLHDDIIKLQDKKEQINKILDMKIQEIRHYKIHNGVRIWLEDNTGEVIIISLYDDYTDKSKVKLRIDANSQQTISKTENKIINHPS